MQRRAVITGIGMICAVGGTRESAWQALVRGECGIRDIDAFDTSEYRTHTGGQAWHLDPDAVAPARERKRMSRADLLALTAGREAWQDAACNGSLPDRHRIGVSFGAGAGGMSSAEQYRRRALKSAHGRAPISYLLSFSSSSATDRVAIDLGAMGPRTTIVTACSSSATAIGCGLDWIRDDLCDVVLTGGAEGLCEVTYGGFNSLRAVDPDRCRPFDLLRKGMSLGECGAVMVLEERERAVRRGAAIYAEVLGYATACDANHMTAPEKTGSGAALAMSEALRDAGVRPELIDYINAHGTGTPLNDAAETAAINSVFAERAASIPVSSSKSMIGHCLGAAGGIETAITALTLARGQLPPTSGWQERDPECDLDYVPDAGRRFDGVFAISNSFAFGGNNTVVVLGRGEGHERAAH